MTFHTSFLKRINNNRMINEQHHLNERFKGFDTKQCSRINLHKIRALLTQGSSGIHDNIIPSILQHEAPPIEATPYLTAAEKQILDVLLESFTLKHATNYVDTINATGKKMQSLHQRETRGEIVKNRRTPSDVCNHYSLFFAMGIGAHKSSSSLVNAKDIIIVDLMRMAQDDPLTLSRCWVSGHVSEYHLERTYATKIGNAKIVISHSKNNRKVYDITYDNGLQLQWSRHFNEELYSGADIAPGIALQLIYLFRMLGGSQNPCINKLYTAESRQICFEWLEKIMPCLMPGTVYPEVKIIGELNLDASYISIEKNLNHTWSQQTIVKHQALVSSIKTDNLIVLCALLKQGYLTNAINEHRLLYLAVFAANARIDILKLLIKYGISAPEDDIMLLAAESLTANELNYLLSQEYAYLDEPLIKSLPNPNPRFSSSTNFLDVIDVVCNYDLSGDKLHVLNQHGANFHKYGEIYLKRALKTSSGITNHSALNFLNDIGVSSNQKKSPNINYGTNFKQKVVAILIGTQRDGRRYVLLGRPRSSINNVKDYYCFPGGSANKTDITLQAAAIRELFEETSIDVNQIPTAHIQSIGQFGDFNKSSHESTSIFLIDIGNTPIKPHACDDLVEVKCVTADQLRFDSIQPIAKYMTLNDKIILGSNAFLINELIVNQQPLSKAHLETLYQILHIEAKIYTLFDKKIALLKTKEFCTQYWLDLEFLMSNITEPTYEFFETIFQAYHSKLLKLAFKYWPDLSASLIHSLFQSPNCIENPDDLYSYGITLAIATQTENPFPYPCKYRAMFHSLFPDTMSLSSTHDIKKTLFIALASARLKMITDEFKKQKNMDVNHEWDDVITVINFLNYYKDMAHLVRSYIGLSMSAFCHSTNAQGLPTIQFICESNQIINLLKNHIDDNCTIHKKNIDGRDVLYIECDRYRLIKLGFNAHITDFLLNYGNNSPFLLVLPITSWKVINQLIKNNAIAISGLDIKISENELLNDYLTHVIQESNNLRHIFLKFGMHNWQLKLFFAMTQSHKTIHTIMINGKNLNELRLNNELLQFIKWINSFPSLDTLVVNNVKLDDLVLLIQMLSELNSSSMLTIRISTSAYLIESYQFIKDLIKQHKVHHEFLFDDAPTVQHQQINDELIVNQWEWARENAPLFIKNILQHDILRAPHTTINTVKKKLFYHWMLQNITEHEQLTLVGLINNNIVHVICSILTYSTTLKSVKFDLISNEHSNLLLQALSQSNAAVEYIECRNMRIDVSRFADVLRKHPVKQLNLSKTIAHDNEDLNGTNKFADAIASHRCLEVLIADETDICILFFKKIIESRSLLFVSYPSEHASSSYVEAMQARCQKNSETSLYSQNGFFVHKKTLSNGRNMECIQNNDQRLSENETLTMG